MQTKKVIIIGAGIAGIATALRLRAKGFEVEVYEANAYPGGKLSELQLGQYRFDAGPSLFTMPMFVDELFELYGENPKQYFNYIKLDTACHYFYPDGTQFNSPSSAEAFTELAHQKFGEDKATVTRFLNKSKFMYNVTRPVFLEKSLHKLSTYFCKTGLIGILNLWRLNMLTSMNIKNTTTFKSKYLVQFFNRYATYNGSNPYVAPATLNIIPHLEFGYGTFFPVKGMHSITQSLVDLAERKGVKFIYNAAVQSIVVEGNRSKGIMLNGQFIAADITVSNMDVYPTYKKLMPTVKTPNKVNKVESSSSALIFYWGISKEFSELGLHNILFSNDYQKEFNTLFNEKLIDNDPTIYINISSKCRQEDAPQGSENWFVMINVPCNEGQDWDALIKTARQKVISKINSMLKTDIEPLIEEEQLLDPRLIESKTSSYKGALYGSSSNAIMSAFFRHANFSGSIRDLYFCGGSVHPGGGIPLCLLSAKITSNLISKQ